MHHFSNSQVANKLREISTAYSLKNSNSFHSRAYEAAADAIEHETSEVEDLWRENKLDQIPSIGESIKAHLEELFRTGQVKHWDNIKKNIPKEVFDFIQIPGVGPKTALEVSKLGAKDLKSLKEMIKNGHLVKKGFSAKVAEKIYFGIEELGFINSGRMLLPFAYNQAQKILDYLKQDKNVEQADALGSLRRMVATIGDLDFAISAKNHSEVVEHIIKMPGVSKVLDKGDNKVTIFLSSGLRLDFLIADPDSYGALLQHFTGSKQHNIHLRTISEHRGLSLSEYGIKDLKTGKILPAKTETDFYKILGMQTPPPEIREDLGEIELAQKHQIPELIELKDIKGDLHTHSSFSLEASHGPGANTIEQMTDFAQNLGYQYLGIADHPPSFTTHTKEVLLKLIEKRAIRIEQINNSKNIRVLNLLEVDILPDGKLSVSDEGLKVLDFVLAGVHSAHQMEKSKMTRRILAALANPTVKVLTHPTGRLLNERDSYDADWEEIFKYCAQNKKALEVNGFPNRLDLTDNLIRMGKSLGAKFVIDTDAHQDSQMDNMRFGVAMGRRGWLERSDVINSWDFKKLSEWFNIK